MFRVPGFGFQVSGSRFLVSGFGFQISGSRFWEVANLLLVCFCKVEVVLGLPPELSVVIVVPNVDPRLLISALTFLVKSICTVKFVASK